MVFLSYLSVLVMLFSVFAQQAKTLSEVHENLDVLRRDRRNLLFPFQTLFQLNIGVATPTALEYVFVNWAVQANFVLPWNVTQVPTNVLFANSGFEGDSKRKRDIDNNNVEREEFQNNKLSKENPKDYDYEVKLHHIYKYVAEVLDGYGHNGSSCVLQTLCQLAAEPLHPYSDEDLLHEIASYLFNPSHDNENSDLPPNDEALQYIEAYNHGLNSEDCLKKYDRCSLSLLDMFSVLH